MSRSPLPSLGAALLAGLAASAPDVLLAQGTAAQSSGGAESQETRDAEGPQRREPERAQGPVEEVVITGSRIRRTEFNSPAPVQIITAERSALAGLITTEEILRGSTAVTGQQVDDSFSGFVTDGGPGANNISLRGLGAQRTLVLVNGKRWAPSGVQGNTNSVDLSAIPSSMISRIEILKDGASSIYGADAVAGVVNVITKEAFDGFQANAQLLGTTEWDGERYVFDLSYGKVADQSSVSFSAQYAQAQPLTRADRDWARCDTSQRITDQDGDGILDNTHPLTGEPLCFGFIYGLSNTALGFLRYEPSLGTPTPANRYYDPRVNGTFGIPFYTRHPVNGLGPNSPPITAMAGTPNPLYDNEGEFYRDELSPEVTDIQPRTDLLSVTSFGQLDFDFAAGQSTAYYEAYFNRRETDARFGHRQFFPVVNGTDATGTALHPFNPFRNLELFGPGLGFAQPVLPTYNLIEPTFNVEVDRYNVFAGLRGDLVGSWDYDFVVGYGRSKGTYRLQQLLDDRVEAAINQIVVDPMTGQVRCSNAALAQFPNCVPANLFTQDALLNGRLPDNVLAFIRKDTEGTTTYEGLSASAYATGSLFTMPAGDVKGVIGAEWREESIDDVPDIEAQNNNYWGFSTAGITRGDDTVAEVFAEVELPLLKNVRFAEEMSINFSGRYTDYDSYGDDTTYRGAFNYRVVPQFGIRATVGTSFRAPDLYEQFLGDLTGFVSNLNDPCINYGNASRPGDPLFDNCARLGLPPNFAPTEDILSITGGADDLFAETSDSFTAGIVIQPESLDVSLAVDFFDIEIENTVASPSELFLLDECYNSANFSSPFCTRVGPRSGPNNTLSFVDASFVNIGKQRSRGVDFNVVYENEFPIGRLTVDLDSTYLIEQEFELFGELTPLEGRWGYPRWSAALDTRFDWRDFQFAWFVDFVGESREDPVFDPGTTNRDRFNETPNVLYHTVSARYRASDWEVIASVRNIFDRDPPYVSDAQGADGATRFLNTLPGVGYDLFGRTFVFQVSKRWD